MHMMSFKTINIVFEVIYGQNKMVRFLRIYMYTPVNHNKTKIPSISDSFGKAFVAKKTMGAAVTQSVDSACGS